MTRQRFEGLRLELVRRLWVSATEATGNRIHHDDNGKEVFMGNSLKMDRVDWSNPRNKEIGSYEKLWEAMKPARELVGM